LIYFFTLFLFPEGGMVGKRAVKYGFIIEFIGTRLPTLQIWDGKKVIPSLKFNTPGLSKKTMASFFFVLPIVIVLFHTILLNSTY